MTMNQSGVSPQRQIVMAALLLSAIVVFSNMSFATNTTVGCGATTAVNLSDENNWKTLCSATVTLSGGTHSCVATAGADVSNTVADEHNRYRFTIAKIKNPATGQTWERRIDVNQDPNSADPIEETVSTVHQFSDLPAGTYTFYWLARPYDSAADNIDVIAYSMGVVCTDGL